MRFRADREQSSPSRERFQADRDRLPLDRRFFFADRTRFYSSRRLSPSGRSLPAQSKRSFTQQNRESASLKLELPGFRIPFDRTNTIHKNEKQAFCWILSFCPDRFHGLLVSRFQIRH